MTTVAKNRKMNVRKQIAMNEAKAEFEAWERNKRTNRKITKDKFKAQRLAKLDMEKLGVLF